MTVHNKKIDIFYFPFGCVVIWGATKAEENEIKEDISHYRKEPENIYADEVVNVIIDSKLSKDYIADEENNKICLKQDSLYNRFAISYAVAQSVKLDTLERYVSNLLSDSAPMQRELSQKGKVSLSKKELSKKIGILFSARYSISLYGEILDIPEFFWRRPSYEPIYIITTEFHDIQTRHSILNKRLDIIHELYTMLSNELNYFHSTRLEVIIVVLIAIEVMLGISQHNLYKYVIEFFKGLAW